MGAKVYQPSVIRHRAAAQDIALIGQSVGLNQLPVKTGETKIEAAVRYFDVHIRKNKGTVLEINDGLEDADSAADAVHAGKSRGVIAVVVKNGTMASIRRWAVAGAGCITMKDMTVTDAQTLAQTIAATPDTDIMAHLTIILEGKGLDAIAGELSAIAPQVKVGIAYSDALLQPVDRRGYFVVRIPADMSVEATAGAGKLQGVAGVIFDAPEGAIPVDGNTEQDTAGVGAADSALETFARALTGVAGRSPESLARRSGARMEHIAASIVSESLPASELTTVQDLAEYYMHAYDNLDSEKILSLLQTLANQSSAHKGYWIAALTEAQQAAANPGTNGQTLRASIEGLLGAVAEGEFRRANNNRSLPVTAVDRANLRQVLIVVLGLKASFNVNLTGDEQNLAAGDDTAVNAVVAAIVAARQSNNAAGAKDWLDKSIGLLRAPQSCPAARTAARNFMVSYDPLLEREFAPIVEHLGGSVENAAQGIRATLAAA